MTSLAAAAVQLARRGYRVLPVGADKAPRLPRGFHDATAEAAVAAGWEWDGGIGLVVPERTLVVDIDPRNGGLDTSLVLQRAHGAWPATRTVRTRNGGWHYYYTLPDDRELRGSLGPGIDVKKPGRGYVLVPPTPGYVYARGGKPAPAPQWLLDELTVLTKESVGSGDGNLKFFPFMAGTGYGLAVLRDELDKIRSLEEGSRRATLNASAFKLAGLVASGELHEDRTLEALLEAALDVGLEEAAALTRIKSGWDAGLRKPWGPA